MDISQPTTLDHLNLADHEEEPNLGMFLWKHLISKIAQRVKSLKCRATIIAAARLGIRQTANQEKQGIIWMPLAWKSIA